MTMLSQYHFYLLCGMGEPGDAELEADPTIYFPNVNPDAVIVPWGQT
jgi:hypothetical protein